MKNTFRSLLLSIAATMLISGIVFAVPLDSKYEVFSGVRYGQLTMHSWTFPDAPSLKFNQFDAFVKYRFGDNDMLIPLSPTNDSNLFVAYNLGVEKCFDYSIIGDYLPSYLTFDLFTEGTFDSSDLIHIGTNKRKHERKHDTHDSKIAAPVPEPATFLLLSCGLLGIAWFVRKKSLP